MCGPPNFIFYAQTNEIYIIVARRTSIHVAIPNNNNHERRIKYELHT
nr:MAG TPA: hypothetical protein [Caudoviricetes sp.]